MSNQPNQLHWTYHQKLDQRVVLNGELATTLINHQLALGPKTIGDYLTIFSLLNQDQVLDLRPVDVCSWRGIYSEAAITIAIGKSKPSDWIEALKRLVSETFTGYKGDTFRYDNTTLLHFERSTKSVADFNFAEYFKVDHSYDLAWVNSLPVEPDMESVHATRHQNIIQVMQNINAKDYETIQDYQWLFRSLPESVTISIKPADVCSWRGSYDEAAVVFEDGQAKPQDWLNAFERLLSESFEGYKGGTYTYDGHTPLHFEISRSSMGDFDLISYLKGPIN